MAKPGFSRGSPFRVFGPKLIHPLAFLIGGLQYLNHLISTTPYHPDLALLRRFAWHNQCSAGAAHFAFSGPNSFLPLAFLIGGLQYLNHPISTTPYHSDIAPLRRFAWHNLGSAGAAHFAFSGPNSLPPLNLLIGGLQHLNYLIYLTLSFHSIIPCSCFTHHI